MSIYLHAAQRPGHRGIPEMQSLRDKERTRHIGQMALPIISALGVLLSLTLALAIPIVIGIAIGAIYFYRKNPEPISEPAPESVKVPERSQNSLHPIPPPYSAPEAVPVQNPSADSPPPYPNEGGADPAIAFWDPSPYWSKNENQVSRSEVEDILAYHGQDPVNVSLSFKSQKKAEAFLKYVDQMTCFSTIGTYVVQKENLNTCVTFRPFPPNQQRNKQQLYAADLLSCLRNEWLQG